MCCYLTDDPGRDVCGVMAHYAKKVGASEDLFAKIRDQLAASSKGEGSSKAPALAGPVVETVRPAAKRPAVSKLKGVGKDRKRLRALAKTGGVAPGGTNNPDLGDFEKAKVQMRKGVEIKLTDPEVALVEAADPGLMMRTCNEYTSRGLVLGRRLSAMMQEEIAAGDKKKLADELATLKVQGFEKALRQADFLYKEVSVTDCRFNVNLDIYDNKMLDVAEISKLKALAEGEEVARDEEGTLMTTPINVGDNRASNEEGVGEEAEAEAADGDNDAGRSRLFSVVSWGRGRRNLCIFRNVAMGLCLLRA
ncbi:hypothetical protein DEO72_LG5g1778 [Vigna unguiculata]|uniref:Uncharacterized protein n=1 Tax=Vigna unguiculata TaxID=3917 RepID=A0A4D6LXS9_VIGUN|nr:hypothetical protein DEO72_LG5g1778 [Vigna unguiculata]